MKEIGGSRSGIVSMVIDTPHRRNVRNERIDVSPGPQTSRIERIFFIHRTVPVLSLK